MRKLKEDKGNFEFKENLDLLQMSFILIISWLTCCLESSNLDWPLMCIYDNYISLLSHHVDNKHSQTCIKRTPLGQRKSGLIRQVASSKRLNLYEIIYDRTRKRWPFILYRWLLNRGDHMGRFNCISTHDQTRSQLSQQQFIQRDYY